MGWESIGAILAPTYDWHLFPIEAVGGSLFRVTQNWTGTKPWAKVHLAQVFGDEFYGIRRLYPSEVPQLSQMPIPFDYRSQGITARRIAIRLSQRSRYWRNWHFLIEFFSVPVSEVDPSLVLASTNAVILLEANLRRKGATIFNDSASPLLLEMAGDPSPAAIATLIDAKGYYEVPFGYTGEVKGLWLTPTIGKAEIREFV